MTSPPHRALSSIADIAASAGIEITHPDRVLYPEQGLTKGELAEFMVSVAGLLLPHVEHRPLSLVRCPRGAEERCFYQRHWKESLGESVRAVEIEEKDGPATAIWIEDLAGLLSLVQVGVLEIHPWGCRIDDLEHPDRLVFDLDPGPGVTWDGLRRAARDLKQRLEALDLVAYLRTTGGKGLHLVLPLQRSAGWEEVRAFSRHLAEEMAAEEPDRFTVVAAKSERTGRIFIDTLRNARGNSAIASYSPRARSGAPVATPIRWAELDEIESAAAWTVLTLPERLRALKKSGEDPWLDFFDQPQILPPPS